MSYQRFEDDDDEHGLIQPYRVTTATRRVCRPIKLLGKSVTLYRSPEVAEYLDLMTGEILPAADVHREHGLPIHFGERVLEREAILHGLRKEVRKFAVFVLKFRNHRRGITPGIDTLVKWYARLTETQACHVRRYVPELLAAGVLDGESLVGPLFQIAGKRKTARQHRAETCMASNRYLEYVRRRVDGSSTSHE